MMPAQQDRRENDERQNAPVAEGGPGCRRGQQITDPHRQRDADRVDDQRPDEGGRVVAIHLLTNFKQSGSVGAFV